MVCFLCKINSLKLFDIVEDDGDIKSAILKHFWFEENFIVHEQICQECWTQLREFHDFYGKVENVHKNAFFEPELKLEDDDDEVKAEICFADTDIKEEPYNNSSDEDFDNRDFDEEEPISKRKKAVKKKSPRKTRTRQKKKKKAEDSDCSDDDAAEKEDNNSAKDMYEEHDRCIREYMDIRCVYCNISYDSFTKMTSHCKKEHGQDGFIECCEKKFKRRTDIYRHILEHKCPVEKLTCDICSKKFKTQRNLRFHKKEIHSSENERQFACHQCPKRFFHGHVLTAHIAKQHSNEPKKFVCELADCGKAFSTSSALKEHMKTHDSSNSYVCDICSKVIKSIYNLKTHMKIHSDNYQYQKLQCPICGQWARDLKKHQNTHINLNLECNECGRFFATKDSLKGHKKYVHSMEKIHHCTFCDKSFKRVENLKEHVATHTGDVLYTCPYCPKTFNSNANMHRHKKRDHREEWLKSKGTKCILERDIQDTLLNSF